MYQGIGGSIGGLLRAIEEQRGDSPLGVNPSSLPGSPIRQLEAPPPVGVESPNSARVISFRPEDVTAPGGPGSNDPGITGIPVPVRSAPTPGFAGQGGPGESSQPSPAPNQPSSPQPAARPAASVPVARPLGLTLSSGKVAGASTSVPSRSSVDANYNQLNRQIADSTARDVPVRAQVERNNQDWNNLQQSISSNDRRYEELMRQTQPQPTPRPTAPPPPTPTPYNIQTNRPFLPPSWTRVEGNKTIQGSFGSGPTVQKGTTTTQFVKNVASTAKNALTSAFNNVKKLFGR